ncbi:MAG: patatin-like phospholipase family protein [Parashewanella sp.]
MQGKTALVLGGGGARAAYQIGVLKAIVEDYPRSQSIPFKILCGSSAGAINATSLATHASCFHLGVKKLDWVWRNFETHHVYQSSISGVIKHMAKMGLKGLQANTINPEAGSLFDNQPLRNLLDKLMDFKRIDLNIERDALTALCVDASCYNDSKSISFFQSNIAMDGWKRSRREGIKTTLYTNHLLASSAIPLVFPSIKLNQKFYGDGSVHQLAPLSSAIHLGAEKILVINLDKPQQDKVKALNNHPSTANIAGHLLDTIFSDTLNSDLERIERVNKTIKLIPEGKRSEYALKPISTLVLKPSEDISKIAARYYYHMPIAVRLLLRTFGITQGSDSSIISYLLFEKAYTQALIDLGYQDGLNRKGEILAFIEK